MPFKSEKIRIAGTRYDLRAKLTTHQVAAIKLLKREGYSYRQLAAMFGCSKWSVQNIIHPQLRKTQKRRSKEYWTEAKRRYRQRKQELYQSGEIHEQKRTKDRRDKD